MDNYVLVVDDNPSDLLITGTHVENQDVVAISAADGFEAIDRMEEYDFKVLIVDLQMPKMSGIELIKRVRRMQKYKDCPVLVTSARKESKDVKLAIQSGANDYLVKPIDSQIFIEKFSRMIGEIDTWNDYEVDPHSSQSAGFLRTPVKIISVSEVRVNILSQSEIAVGECFDISGDLFGHETVLSVRVEECNPEKEGFVIKLSFIGLTEEIRKKIRLTCRKMWSEKKGT